METIMDEQKVLELLNAYYSIEFTKVTFLRDGGCLSYSVESDSMKYLLKIVKPNFMIRPYNQLRS
jgi:hypothetical protein